MSIFSSDKSSAESGHINVIAEFQAKAGQEEALRLFLSALVEPSRKEDGCKGYHLLQGKHDLAIFFTYEEWTSEDALKAHLEGARSKLEEGKAMLATNMKLTVLTHLI